MFEVNYCSFCGHKAEKKLVPNDEGWYHCDRCGCDIQINTEGKKVLMTFKNDSYPISIPAVCYNCGTLMRLNSEQAQSGECTCSKCGQKFRIHLDSTGLAWTLVDDETADKFK